MAIDASTILKTKFGEFNVAYHKKNSSSQKQFCVSFSKGDISLPNCIVRLQSSCLFGETFGAIDCDCKLQVEKSLSFIGKNGGVVIYLYQEGRGLGLLNKIKAMGLERKYGIDTVDAFLKLHFELDPRDYSMAVQALTDLHVNKSIRLITNNPRKKAQLEKVGYITKKITLSYPTSPLVKKYLQVKKEKLGHEF